MAWQQGLHSFVDPAQAAVHATRAELQAAWNSGIATCAKGPGRSAWRRAVALFEATTAQRLQADIVTCNACLSAYGKAEHWKAVLKILGSTAQKSLRNSVISYGIAITCSDWTQSQHLLKQLKDEFLETNAISYNSAMASGEALGPLAPLAWKSAEGLLAKMSNEGCSADVISYNAQLHHLANGHGRHGHHGHHGRLPAWSRAVHLVKQLQCRGLQPTTVTFNSAMTSSAWEVALVFLGALHASALRPSDATAAALRRCAWPRAVAMPNVRIQPIFALEDASCWQQVLQRLGDYEVQPLLRCNSALSACAKATYWTSAIQLLDDHPGFKEPDVVAYGTTISACERCGEWLHAIGILQALQIAKLRADEMCLNAVIGACAKSKEWRMALHFYALSGPGEADLVALGSVLSACEAVSAWRHALALLSGRRTRGANIILYNSTISACAKSNLWELSLQLFAEAQRQLQLTVISYNSVLYACEICGQWSQALLLLAKLEGSTLQPDSTTYASVIGSCERGQQIDKASVLLAELKRGKRSVLRI